MLTAFFKLYSEDDFARTLAHDKVPGGTKLLNKKLQLNVRKTEALGRVCVVHPNNSECLHLRILPHIVKGPTSFISLRTFQGITQEKFQGFCKAMYLLEDYSHWESTLSEGVLCFSAKSLKSLTHIFFGKIIAKAWLKIYCIADFQNCHKIIYISIKVSLIKLYLN